MPLVAAHQAPNLRTSVPVFSADYPPYLPLQRVPLSRPLCCPTQPSSLLSRFVCCCSPAGSPPKNSLQIASYKHKQDCGRRMSTSIFSSTATSMLSASMFTPRAQPAREPPACPNSITTPIPSHPHRTIPTPTPCCLYCLLCRYRPTASGKRWPARPPAWQPECPGHASQQAAVRCGAQPAQLHLPSHTHPAHLRRGASPKAPPLPAYLTHVPGPLFALHATPPVPFHPPPRFFSLSKLCSSPLPRWFTSARQQLLHLTLTNLPSYTCECCTTGSAASAAVCGLLPLRTPPYIPAVYDPACRRVLSCAL